MKRLPIILIVASMILAVVACDNPTSSSSSSSSSPAGPAAEDVQAFVGTAAFTDASASIRLEIPGVTTSGVLASAVTASAVRTVSGTITYDGTSYNVSGSFNTDTGALEATVTAGSLEIRVSGTYTAATGFDGTITRSTNGGATTEEGSVDLKEVGKEDSVDDVTSYLGTYSGDAGGQWNMTIDGTTITGSWWSSDLGNGGFLSGSLSGDALSITARDTDGIKIATASGTRSGSSVSGTWSDVEGATGTWTGSEQ